MTLSHFVEGYKQVTNEARNLSGSGFVFVGIPLHPHVLLVSTLSKVKKISYHFGCNSSL